MFIEFGMVLNQSATSYKQKKQKYFSLPDHQLAENLIFVLVFKKGQKEDKGEFVTKSVGIIVTIIFM